MKVPVLDTLMPEYVADPYPFFELLRECEPVHRARTGAWILTRYQDVVDALTDSRLGNAPSRYAVINERHRGRFVCADVANNILPFLDGPLHTAPRRLISRTFNKQLQQSASTIAGVAERAWNRAAANERIDIQSDFATPCAVEVISELLGVPPADRQRLKGYTERFFYLFTMIPSLSVREQLDESLVAFREYFQHLVQSRRKRPEPDLVTALLQANDQALDTPLSDLALVDNLLLLFADGVENVDSAITTMVALLLLHREQLDRLRQESALIPLAVDECLRFESPAQFIGRIALEDMTLHGIQIKRHTTLLLMLGSANRDPDVFDRPQQFLIDRRLNPYLSFGKGGHNCVGASLVRQEMIAALRVMLPKLPSMSLTEDELQWQQRPGHRWLARLDVECKPS